MLRCSISYNIQAFVWDVLLDLRRFDVLFIIRQKVFYLNLSQSYIAYISNFLHGNNGQYNNTMRVNNLRQNKTRLNVRIHVRKKKNKIYRKISRNQNEYHDYYYSHHITAVIRFSKKNEVLMHVL